MRPVFAVPVTLDLKEMPYVVPTLQRMGVPETGSGVGGRGAEERAGHCLPLSFCKWSCCWDVMGTWLVCFLPSSHQQPCNFVDVCFIQPGQILLQQTRRGRLGGVLCFFESSLPTQPQSLAVPGAWAGECGRAYCCRCVPGELDAPVNTQELFASREPKLSRGPYLGIYTC